jgi:hypothetical protein
MAADHAAEQNEQQEPPEGRKHALISGRSVQPIREGKASASGDHEQGTDTGRLAGGALGVGLVSVPALGAVAVEQRVRQAVLRLVDGLLGESVPRRRDPAGDRRRTSRMRAACRSSPRRSAARSCGTSGRSGS